MDWTDSGSDGVNRVGLVPGAEQEAKRMGNEQELVSVLSQRELELEMELDGVCDVLLMVPFGKALSLDGSWSRRR